MEKTFVFQKFVLFKFLNFWLEGKQNFIWKNSQHEVNKDICNSAFTFTSQNTYIHQSWNSVNVSN